MVRLTALLPLVFLAFRLPLPADVLALQQRLMEVYEENRDAVVRVKAAFRDETEEGRPHVTLKVGTGFFVSQEGHVLVNASRAAGADRIWVEFHDEPYVAEPVGHDRLTNLSVLRVVEPPPGFKFIPVDASLPKPKPGAVVFGISCPLDFKPSPAVGLVSGIENKIGAQVFPTEYIRTTLPVDAGRGGCPVLDIHGRLLGITVASIPDMDASYAMPVEALVRVRDDLLFSGKMVHSWIGFRVAEAADAEGARKVYLSSVVEGAPAEEAGLREGDVLLSIGGREIFGVADVPAAVFFTRANQYTTVRVQRGGEVSEVSVKTLPRPESDPVIAPRPGKKAGAAEADAAAQD
jgi:serine protease Do